MNAVAQGLESSSGVFPEHQQGSGLEVKQPGYELAATEKAHVGKGLA